jgi:hypothetical protein
MNKKIYNTVQQCIETSKSINYIFRIDLNRWVINSDNIKLLDSHVKELLDLLKHTYPDYYEELKSADDAYQNAPHYCHAYMDAIFSLIEKQLKHYVEYVNSDRIDELKNISSRNFDLIKLIQFCKELNFAYNAKSYLAVPLLVRGIIDHVPPIFGKNNFSEVVGGHGTKSFQDSMVHLDKTSRKIADAIIHTQIRTKEVLPNETQINFKADLDVLLAEVYRLLK